MNSLTGTEKAFVCGAGHQGLSMAAHLALNGVEVSLWNRTKEHISEVIETKTIHCSGKVNGNARIEKVSSQIETVISDCVMVTTPSSAHKDVARVIAPYVHGDMIVVLNPGRTFGAIEFAEELKEAGAPVLPHIAETQTIVYTCRKSGPNSTTILALKRGVEIATIKGSSIDYIQKKIPTCLKPHFTPVNSVLSTSLSNVGMILHCAPVLMNVGWIESKKTVFKYYYEGISESISHYLEKMDAERLSIAEALGCQGEAVKEWMQR